jgi:hypothetical protein
MAAGRGGLVATARNDLVNFGFQEPWKIPADFFQGLEKFPQLAFGAGGLYLRRP